MTDFLKFFCTNYNMECYNERHSKLWNFHHTVGFFSNSDWYLVLWSGPAFSYVTLADYSRELEITIRKRFASQIQPITIQCLIWWRFVPRAEPYTLVSRLPVCVHTQFVAWLIPVQRWAGVQVWGTYNRHWDGRFARSQHRVGRVVPEETKVCRVVRGD